jgi:hypothetical protein
MRTAKSGGSDGEASVRVIPAPGPGLESGTLKDLVGERDDDPRLRTARSPSYLQWRYTNAPLLGYRAAVETVRGRTEAVAWFRVRSRGRLAEAAVCDLLVRRRDRQAATRVLRRIARAATVDHMTCSFPPGAVTAAASSRAGFFRVPFGPTLVVRAISDAYEPDPLDMRSWALTLGDVEVF